MGRSKIDWGPRDRAGTTVPQAASELGGATPRQPAVQAPHVISYELQQFIRLTGSQRRLSLAEIAYHNRAHDRSREPK